MAISDAEDASPEPEASAEQDLDQDQEGIDDSMADAKDSVHKTESVASSDQQNSSGQSKPNAKDPQRPRRKKARRACFACQRAHLTCGTYNQQRGFFYFKKPRILTGNQETSGHVYVASSEVFKINVKMACGRRLSIFMIHRLMH
jgi:hypothetical protein